MRDVSKQHPAKNDKEALRELNALIVAAERDRDAAMRSRNVNEVTRLVKRITGLEARRKAVKSKGIKFLRAEAAEQWRYPDSKPGRPKNKLVQAIMKHKKCKRPAAYYWLNKMGTSWAESLLEDNPSKG